MSQIVFFEILILLLVRLQIFLKLAGALYVVSLSYVEGGSEGVHAGIAGRGASGLYLAYTYGRLCRCAVSGAKEVDVPWQLTAVP